MTMEILDILDCTGRKTGRTVPRDEAHRTGAWHGAFHCLIIYEREGGNYALFQLRSVQKLIAPGRFDVSVGGHYAAGEGAVGAGPREIKEELGLDVAFGELLPLGRRVFVYCFTPLEKAVNSCRETGGKKPLSVIGKEQGPLTGFAAGVMEYEFQDVFLLPASAGPQNMALQDDEVAAALEMDIDAGIKLFSGELRSVEGRLLKNGGITERTRVSADDFVPCLDNYYLKLLLLAKRYFNGERRLLVI
jgi:isopentenyldiphosphate isomerase